MYASDCMNRQYLVTGTGASPEGNKPFLDVLDVDSGETERLWQSSPPSFESTGSLLCDLEDKPIRYSSWFPNEFGKVS